MFDSVVDKTVTNAQREPMNNEFPFVKVPEEALELLGKKDKETRVYRHDGREEDTGTWYDKIAELFGPAVSPGGVCMYARVSRAAVYKAITEGRLTAFGYHAITESRSVFGFKKRKRETPYLFVPVSEAKAWGQIIEEKARAKTLTREDDPGWVDDRTYRKLTDGIERGKYPKKKGGKK